MSDDAKAREVIARGRYDTEREYRPTRVEWDRTSPDVKDAYRQDADAILAALDAAGLVVVPREPTDEMVRAAADAMWDAEDEVAVEFATLALRAALAKEEGE